MDQLQNRIKKILDFYHRNRRFPSYREIMKLLGYRSTNAVHRFISKLLDLEMVKRDAGGRILPSEYLTGVPLLGIIGASFPSAAEEELTDSITLEDYLIENKQATFMLTVRGDSMTEAGIMPGDLVLVERNRSPKDGDIVVAQIDNEWTMKYFRNRGGQICLMPGNSKYKPLIPQSELNITAVVKAVVRKY